MGTADTETAWLSHCLLRYLVDPVVTPREPGAARRGPCKLLCISSEQVRYWLKIEATTTAECVRSARLRLMDVQIYRTAPWRATAVFAGTERDDDDDDGLAWGEVISYEPSPDLGDVPVAVPIPSAPPVEAVRA